MHFKLATFHLVELWDAGFIYSRNVIFNKDFKVRETVGLNLKVFFPRLLVTLKNGRSYCQKLVSTICTFTLKWENIFLWPVVTYIQKIAANDLRKSFHLETWNSNMYRKYETLKRGGFFMWPIQYDQPGTWVRPSWVGRTKIKSHKK